MKTFITFTPQETQSLANLRKKVQDARQPCLVDGCPELAYDHTHACKVHRRLLECRRMFPIFGFPSKEMIKTAAQVIWHSLPKRTVCQQWSTQLRHALKSLGGATVKPEHLHGLTPKERASKLIAARLIAEEEGRYTKDGMAKTATTVRALATLLAYQVFVALNVPPIIRSKYAHPLIGKLLVGRSIGNRGYYVPSGTGYKRLYIGYKARRSDYKSIADIYLRLAERLFLPSGGLRSAHWASLKDKTLMKFKADHPEQYQAWVNSL